jgi:hypothetical protein
MVWKTTKRYHNSSAFYPNFFYFFGYCLLGRSVLGATNGSGSGRTEGELSDDDDADFDFKVSTCQKINTQYFL